MDCITLIPRACDLTGLRLGNPQRTGPLTMAPIFGADVEGEFASPRSDLKLARVHTYGRVELQNGSTQGLAIVPLHMGYIQDGAQNHALCGSALLGSGQKRVFEDACCVQAAQGGLLEGRDQWFFILPLALREAALKLRGRRDYSKLWAEIAKHNGRFGLSERGHLEQILTRQRATLTQYQSRLELLPGQVGALIFLRDRLVGLELAPTAAYFAEIWMPLTCFCYGVAALMQEQRQDDRQRPFPPLDARSLPELREQLRRQRLEVQTQVQAWLATTPRQTFAAREEERYLRYRLSTMQSAHYAGQIVEEVGPSPASSGLLWRWGGAKTAPPRRAIYASIFARHDTIMATAA
jgi:hypothetical protein